MKKKPGYIWVKSYVRKDGTKVRGHWTLDRGKKGKGKKIFTLNKNKHIDIRKSYSDKKNKEILDKDVKKYGYNKTMKRLNALYILHKNDKWNKKLNKYKIWLKKKYGGR